MRTIIRATMKKRSELGPLGVHVFTVLWGLYRGPGHSPAKGTQECEPTTLARELQQESQGTATSESKGAK